MPDISDHVIVFDQDGDGVGDLIIKSGKLGDVARIHAADGSGTGWANLLGGSQSPISLISSAADWDVITQYKVGQYVQRAGRLLVCAVDHTSSSTYGGFNAANWTDVSAAPSAEPISRITLRGEATGGDTYDTTPHLTFESYQRPQGGFFSESVRFHMLAPNAKAIIAWRLPADPSTSFDPSTNPLKTMAWFHAHYAAQNDGQPVHGHLEIEIPDSTMSLQGRFGIDFINQTTKAPGIDLTSAYFSATDLSLRQSNGEVFRIAAGAGVNERKIEFSSSSGSGVSPGYFDPAKKRWWILADAVAEAGADAGSNFVLRRYADDGTTANTVLYANRATGNITLGNAADQAAKMAAIWAGGGAHGFYAAPSASPNSGFASFATKMFAAGDRALDIRVSGDGNPRMTVDGNGKHSWGNAAGATDITLQRLAAKVLGVGAAETFRTGVAATASRPTASSVGAGSQFYDSTLSKPIWSDGTNWKDAAGTTV